MSTNADETVETKRFIKAWEINGTDVVRFVLRRAEWNLLIEAIAGAASWQPQDGRRSRMWNALEVLRNAEEDIDTSALIRALTKITTYARERNPDVEIIGRVASSALDAVKGTESK